MLTMRRWFAKLANWFWPARAERDLAREIDAHVGLLEEEYRRRGLSGEEARFAAKRAFGGVEQAKERQREERSLMWLDEIRRDLRYALRSLRRTPGFTIVAVLTLALGIGASTIIFSFADASLLNPLPFPHGDRLVSVNEVVPLVSNQPIRLTAPDLIDYEQQARAFAALGGWTARAFELSGGHESEHVQAARFTANMFEVLQVRPARGRVFTAHEDQTGARVCVISNGLWQRWFGADPSALGRTIDLDRVPYTVIGIMPRGFEYPLPGPSDAQHSDIWVPMSFTATERQARLDNWDYNGVARMKPDVTVAQASADVNAIARHIVSDLLPPRAAGHITFSALVQPLAEQVSGPVRPLVLLLLGAVGCLLLIACVNVTNLLLARGATRERDFAVRVALGAGRGRLVRQLLFESLLLAVVSAVAGGLLAWWSIGAVSALMPARFALLGRARFDWAVLVFVAGLAVVTAVAVGTAPGWAATSRLRVEAIKDRGASAGSVPHRRLRSLLVVAEVGLSLVLLVGAGLLTRSFNDLLETSPGFEPEGAVAASVRLPEEAYPDAVRERTFYRRLHDRLHALSHTEFVGVGSALPLSGRRTERDFTADDYTPPPMAKLSIVGMTTVSGEYLQAIGAMLVRGRYFTPQDGEGSAPVAIVTQGVAHQFWPGESPIGKRVKWGPRDSPLPWMTVVGEVNDLKQDALDAPAAPQVFVPADQLAATMSPEYQAVYIPAALRAMFIAVRGRGNTSALATGLRAGVQQIDPQLALTDLRPLSEVVASSAAPNRFNMLLMGVFSIVALLLAAIGVYGVIAYSVAQRTQEIGIRMALGADAGAVARMVLSGGIRLAAMGIGVGVIGAALLAPLIRSLLFGVRPLDVPTFAAAVAVLLAIAAVASYVPARRAARVDPQTALRSE